MTFALPRSYDQYCVKTFARKVKTKSWVKLHKNHLLKTYDRLTNANCDINIAIKVMLHNAYGVNIGDQVFEKLKTKDLERIRVNILTLFNG